MHEGFLQQAIDLAADNVRSGDGGPYGAIIVKDNRLIAASGNKVTCTLDPTAHAEIAAIRLACIRLNDFQLPDCILYTSCEPCPMCLGAIYWARLAKVYYAVVVLMPLPPTLTIVSFMMKFDFAGSAQYCNASFKPAQCLAAF